MLCFWDIASTLMEDYIVSSSTRALPSHKKCTCCAFHIVLFKLQNRTVRKLLFFQPTTVLFLQSHILTSEDADTLSEELPLPHLPDMLFLHNRLKVWPKKWEAEIMELLWRALVVFWCKICDSGDASERGNHRVQPCGGIEKGGY